MWPEWSVWKLSPMRSDVRRILMRMLLSCQPSVTVTSCFVYKVIWGLESKDHLCINPIHRIGLIDK